MSASGKFIATARTLGHKTAHGFLALTHNGFALLGLAVAISALILISRPDLRLAGEAQLRQWLDARHTTVAEAGDADDLQASGPIAAVTGARPSTPFMAASKTLRISSGVSA